MRSQTTFSAILWMIGLIVVGGMSMCPAQVSAQDAGWEYYMAEGAKAYQDGQETNAEMFYLAAHVQGVRLNHTNFGEPRNAGHLTSSNT